jgi:transcription elongation GreA/GreB family factor
MSTQVVQDLESALADELERASANLMVMLQIDPPNANGSAGRSRSQLQDRIRFIGSLLAGLKAVDPAYVRRGRVGLGSAVRTREIQSEDLHSFLVVPFDLADGTPEKVTPASPIGQAILGTKQGDVVEIATPVRTRVMRVEHVATIWDALEGWREDSSSRRTA